MDAYTGVKPRIRRKVSSRSGGRRPTRSCTRADDGPSQSSAIKVLSRTSTFSTNGTDEVEHLPEHAPAVASNSYSSPNLPTGSLSQALEHLRRTVQKRITTWTYLRSAHQGQVFWFNVSRVRCGACGARARADEIPRGRRSC